MRSQWRAVVIAALRFAAWTNAQTRALTDLGTLFETQKNLTTFYGLIQKYPQILLQLPSYTGVTILAPNNDAFNKIPYTELKTAFQNNDQDTIANVLEYHILQGTRYVAQLIPGLPVFIPTLLTNKAWSNVTGGQRVQNVKQAGDFVVFVSGDGSRSSLVQPDLMFSGGAVQVIDSLLIPPSNITSTTTAFNLTSFQGSLYATNKLEIFSQTANITIFAPANSAFQALGPAISALTVEQLSSVLDYHLLPGQVIYSTSLTNNTKFATQHGGDVTILHAGNTIYINSAQLVTPDILLANGVLHIIDNVLNPQGPNAQPNPQTASQVPVFTSASVVDTLPFTSAIPCTTNCPVPTSASSSGNSTSSVGLKIASTAKSSSVFSSSSKASGVAMPRETGYGATRLIIALGGAVMMI